MNKGVIGIPVARFKYAMLIFAIYNIRTQRGR